MTLLAERAPATAAAGVLSPAASVVICAYASGRWESLVAAVDSTARQTRPALETIVVVDHNPELLRRARARLGYVEVLTNDGPRGLSGARNTGVEAAQGEIVVFLDDDALADQRWLEELLSVYDDPNVLGAGGVANPIWVSGAVPRWLPSEFYWTVGCSYRGLPTGTVPVRNPIGANMSFRRSTLERIDGFRDGIGRVGRTPLGCEETELAIRVRRENPGATILHVPTARVAHAVPAERANWRYYFSRCWAEGLSKALVAAEVGADDALASERTYTLRTLPEGVMRGLGDALRGDRGGLLRAAAIVCGLLVTAAGYLRGRLAIAR